MNANKFRFGKAATVVIENEEYRLLQLVGDVWNCTNTKTGLFTSITATQLLEGYRNGSIKVGHSSVLMPVEAAYQAMQTSVALDMLSPAKQKEIKARRQFLGYLAEQYGVSPAARWIQYAIDQEWSSANGYADKKPSVQMVRRWLKRYQASGNNILALNDMTHLRGNKQTKIGKKVAQLCMDALHAMYLKPERGTLTHTLSLARDLVRNENTFRNELNKLPIPGITTLRSLINRMPVEEVYAIRYGAEAARVKFRHSINSTISEYPMDRYEIDHTRLDIMVVDPQTGIILGRPWLTLMIDTCTKAMVGFFLSLESPSCSALAGALKHALLPKTYLSSRYPDIRNRWGMHGLPIVIVCDNAMEFHAASFAAACLTLGIELKFMPRKTPWWKGAIERAIGTLNSSVSSLAAAGRTFHSIQEKGDYDPKKKAVMTLEAMEQIITMWIVDHYHQRQHRTIGTTPQWKWDSMIDPERILYLEDPQILDGITGHLAQRTVSHYGIEINCVHYNCTALQLQHRNGLKKATIRWNSENIGKITVALPMGALLEVPATPRFQKVNGISLKQYRLSRQDLINKGLSADNQEELDSAIVRIVNFANETAKTTRVAKRKFERQTTTLISVENPTIPTLPEWAATYVPQEVSSVAKKAPSFDPIFISQA